MGWTGDRLRVRLEESLSLADKGVGEGTHDRTGEGGRGAVNELRVQAPIQGRTEEATGVVSKPCQQRRGLIGDCEWQVFGPLDVSSPSMTC